MSLRRERALVPALLVLIALLATGCGNDSDSSGSDSSSSSSTSTTTTTIPSTEQPATAIWPFTDSTTRYSEPAAAAEGFAIDYLGFATPVIGTFAAGDSRSGEVTVQPTPTGPVTTVAVRQLTNDDTWWVLAAITPNLQLQVPNANTSITSPVTLSGESTAFEGTVTVEVREDGTVTPVGSDFVTGGANGEFGPFSKAISFTPPTAASGAIVLKTFGGENGVVWEATVIRVQFG
jgi:hypothetical protein